MNFIEITDINAPELDVFSRLSEVQLYRYYEPEIGIFLAESANVILRALEAGYEPLSMLVETNRIEIEARPVFDAIEKLFGKDKLDALPIYTADNKIVTQLTGYTLVRGLWMTLRRKPETPVEEFCADKKRITVLFDVVNPTNVGAIIRSAAALGMDGALLSYASVDPLTRRSARVSMGTVFQVPWTIIPDEERISCLKELGFKTVALALRNDTKVIDDPELKAADKIAIFLASFENN